MTPSIFKGKSFKKESAILTHFKRPFKSANIIFYFMGTLTPKSDQYLVSPYSNTAQSNIKVVRKKEVINK